MNYNAGFCRKPRIFVNSMAGLLLGLVLICLTVPAASYIVVPDLPSKHYLMMGDFNIGVLVPVHNYSMDQFCSSKVRNMGILQRLEAIRFAVEEINNKTDILPNHKLGFVMYDDCYKGITALAQSLHFITKRGEGECLIEEKPGCYNDSITTYEVVGILGSESSATTVQMANLFSSFQIPQISYLATGASLTDNNSSYPYFKRVVPPDTLQAKAIVSLLVHFNWSYVSVVYLQGEYGAAAYKKLYEEGNRIGVCFAEVAEIRKDFRLSDYNLVMYSLLLVNKAKVVIAIVPQEEARELMNAAQRLSVDGRITWIASDAWARDINDLAGYESIAYGMLSVNILSSSVPRFDKHFQSLKLGTPTKNPWITEFYESFYHCTMEDDGSGQPLCNPESKISDHPRYLPDNIVSLVFDTVYAFAVGLHAALESPACSALKRDEAIKCARQNLDQHLDKVNFTGETGPVMFDAKGDLARDYIVYNLQNNSKGFNFVHITTWRHATQNLTFTGNSIQWSKGEQPPSFCSSLCGTGEQMVLQQKRCCWVCEACAEDQYTRLWYGTQRCYTCTNRTWPDAETRTKCLPIQPAYLKWHDVLGIMLSALASTGLAACIVTVVVFIVSNNNPLIKASSRELSYFMLAGVVTNYAVVFCFLMKPNDTVCFIRFLSISICFTFLYGPLVTKTIRIYRIFDAGSRMNRRPTCVSSKSQIGIVVNLLLLHICIIVGWAVAARPLSQEIHSAPNIVELVCYFPLGPIVTSLIYNGLLVLASVYYAFKTRKLPDNYNESKFISFCVYSIVVIWLAFVPAYFAVGKAFYEVLFLSLVVLSNASLILCCMFMPKIYALYFVDKEDLHVSPRFMNRMGTRRLVEECSASTNSDANAVDVKPDKALDKSATTSSTLDKNEKREAERETASTPVGEHTPTMEDAATSTDMPYKSTMIVRGSVGDFPSKCTVPPERNMGDISHKLEQTHQSNMAISAGKGNYFSP